MNQKHFHKEQLGYEVPQGYFESSKKDMLNFKFEKVSKMSSFFGSKTILTASILGVITFAFLLVQKQQLSNYEINTFEELTIESLEVNDEVFDDWFDEKFVYSEVY
ncbi:MAG: hypothetical protein ACJ0P7_03045 [Flavobacteriaceae bacterium]|jgi:hypothetical protein|nr:hypothetical protein [Flavobacteriaceae bacterium]|tara:strand:- start:4693 stop:5010 length:318 start_codon:yes stop_codon:yes gene_type:complete